MRPRLVLALVSGAVLLVMLALVVARPPWGDGVPRTAEASPPALVAEPEAEIDSAMPLEQESPVSDLGLGPELSPDQGPDPAGIEIEFEAVASGLDNVVVVTHAGDGSGRLFIVEKKGVIRVFEDGGLVTEPFLDITDRVQTTNSQNDEAGLLGLAFHPDYESNGRFFVDYIGRPRRTVVAEFAAEGNVADPDSEREVLTEPQPQGNHNGGQLAFGPDGYLYIALGDGGGAGDPDRNGQNLRTLLGTILRIDIDGAEPYEVPEDNPFVGQAAARDEIWAYGLRNPWRFSFDRVTDDLYIADVGQREIEEVDFQPADSPGGENYGWNIMEGSDCYQAPNCNRNGLVLPVAEYAHSGGHCSITGGYVYRGQEFPGLSGAYFFGDWCSRFVWGLSRDEAGEWRMAQVGRSEFNIATFGEDENGEVYVGGVGRVARIVQAGAPTPTATDPTPETSPTPTEATTTATATPGTVTPTPSRSPEPTDPTESWMIYTPLVDNRRP